MEYKKNKKQKQKSSSNHNSKAAETKDGLCIPLSISDIVNQSDKGLNKGEESLSNLRSFRLVIEAKPNSKESKVTEICDQFIGVNIASPPKQGQANQELINYLSHVLQVKRNKLFVDKGSKSRHKVLVIQDAETTKEALYEALKDDIFC